MTARILLTCCMLCALTACSRNNIDSLTQSLKQLAEPKKEIEPKFLELKGPAIFEYFTGQDETTFKNATNVTVIYDEKSGTYRPVIKPGTSGGPFTLNANGDFTITNLKTGITYNAGQFETYTKKTFEKTQLPAIEKKGTFNIVVAKWTQHVDSIERQYAAAFKEEKAAFLAASNYDGIEEIGGTDDPSVASNLWDPTQGPAVSLGALPGMLLRLYSQIREDERVSTNFFDPNNPRVHMLKMTSLVTQNGYVYFTYPMHGTAMELTQENFQNILNGENYTCGIMYHKNVSVTASNAIVVGQHFESFTVPEPHPTTTIDQIFAAGLSLGQYRETLIAAWSGKPKKWITSFAELLAQKILDDIYALSIQAAAKNGRNVLYLLPIGCGAFGNKHLWVAKALEKAKNLIIDSGITVKFTIWPGNNPNSYESEQEYNEFIAILKKLVKDTGGNYKSL